MRIQLCAATCVYGDIDANIATIEQEAKEAKKTNADLILFGEAFLQGFEAITFEYRHDATVALGLHSVPIARVRTIARDQGVGIGFGFFENDHGAFYASYMIVGKDGEIIHLYKRVSEGWKIPGANADYREGKEFSIFEFEGRQLAVVVCGDMWEDHLLDPILDLNHEVDLFLWPVHTDYAIDVWENGGEHEAYIERTSILAKPIAFINNYVETEDLAKGGAYIWHQGKEIAALPPGAPGRLLFDC